MSGIELYFKEENWQPYVDICPEPANSEQFELLVQQIRNNDIARVTWRKLDKHSLSWINGSVPALEGLTPLNCLSTPELTKRLKECLLRMP